MTGFIDLTKPKHYFRYFKKGFLYGLMYVLAWNVIGYITYLFGVNFAVQNLTQLQLFRFKELVVFTTAMIVSGIVAGFLVEFVNDSKSKFIKWVNK